MRRRALLGTLASLTVAGCAGLGRSPATTRPTTRPPTTAPTTSTPDASGSTTDTATPEEPSEATPPELRTLGVPATQSDCPLGERGRAVCYPAQADAALSLAPADDRLDLPADSTTFALSNDTDHEYRANFYAWTLYKREHGRWFHVAPGIVPQPLHGLSPGASHEWAFSVDNHETPTGGPSEADAVHLAGLGGGEYTFTVDGWFPVDDGTEQFYVAAGAEFALDGGPVELTLTENVTATRSGDRVVVTAGGDPGEGETTARLRARRGGEAEVPPNQPIEPRITEQLLRPSPFGDDQAALRNALAAFEAGVETTVYEGPTDESPPFGIETPLYLRYGEDVYEVTSEPVD